jgi:hypothetical protein
MMSCNDSQVRLGSSVAAAQQMLGGSSEVALKFMSVADRRLVELRAGLTGQNTETPPLGAPRSPGSSEMTRSR